MPHDADADAVLSVLRAAAVAARVAIDGLHDWGPSGTRDGQYRTDVVADAACTEVLDRAGFGWLSEESGVCHGDRPTIVVVDPIDGSTNASMGLPWYATSLCAVDVDGPVVALVVNQATGRTYDAIRGGGARVDGRPIAPSQADGITRSIVGISGHPSGPIGRQFRALGAAALDLCAVADGTLDGFVDCSPSAHGIWDYLGGLLVCREAGAVVSDAFGRDLLGLGVDDRRTPVAGGTQRLHDELVAWRREGRASGDPR